MPEPVRLLITGGAGFLGKRLIAELRDMASDRGVSLIVRSLDLNDCEDANESVVGDVSDFQSVEQAMREVDVVVHTAALIDWGNTPTERVFEVNVEGTRNVLEAARQHGVKAAVFTGTMDAVMDGGPLVAIDESQPYPSRFMDAYAESKAAAEQLVLEANGPELRTTVLRACGMYGEADPYHMDNVLEQAQQGKLTFRIGSPDTVFEHVYVGNVAYAHALAVFALLADTPPAIAGNKYFVTDQPADNFFEFMRPFIEQLGYSFPSARRTIPAWAAMLAGRANEGFARFVQPVWKLRPVLTRSSVSVLTNSISISSTRLADDLGYQPRYSVTEAFDRVIAHYADQHPR